jgi:S-adenosylmethionine synthetase
MIEKVNPSHPDKIADRIAGAIVDLAYQKSKIPKVAAEVLIGHGLCCIITESSEAFAEDEVGKIVNRIAGSNIKTKLIAVKQDEFLSKNQAGKRRCGDNGIFKGVPLSNKEVLLSQIARSIYKSHPHDGKYILDKNRLVICQSNTSTSELRKQYTQAVINPLGEWTGGTNVDTGATNRKLGSDMAQSMTGGGLHGKDLSKADVSVNIYAFLKAQETGETVELSCAIGDESIDGKPYEEIIEIAMAYVKNIGGFEKFAEWGLF